MKIFLGKKVIRPEIFFFFDQKCVFKKKKKFLGEIVDLQERSSSIFDPI